jgi:pyrroline-5-carboxylate reductase
MATAASERALLIVGGGRMGEALVAGLLAAGRNADELAIAEVSPARREELAAAHPDVTIVEAPIPAAGAVLAVKPADVGPAAAAVAEAGAERLLSIAAGVTTDAIERATGGARARSSGDAEHSRAGRRRRYRRLPGLGGGRG